MPDTCFTVTGESIYLNMFISLSFLQGKVTGTPWLTNVVIQKTVAPKPELKQISHTTCVTNG
jgi:hypothetical protein